MANPEDFNAAPSPKTDDSTNRRLYEGAYIQRSGDSDPPPFIKIRGNGTEAPVTEQPAKKGAGQPAATESEQPTDDSFVEPGRGGAGNPNKNKGQQPITGGAGDWRRLPTDVRTPSSTWHDPTKTQWNGRKPDISRSPGGTFIQPRPGFIGSSENPAPMLHGRGGVIGSSSQPFKLPPEPANETVGPVTEAVGPLKEAPVMAKDTPSDNIRHRTMRDDAAGRQVGPIIISPEGAPQAAHDAWKPVGLRGLEIQPKTVSEAEVNRYALSSLHVAGFAGGALIGMKCGKLRGAAAGAVIGVVVGQIAKYTFE